MGGGGWGVGGGGGGRVHTWKFEQNSRTFQESHLNSSTFQACANPGGVGGYTSDSNLVYKFKRIVGKPNFSDQFKKIVKRYIMVGYNLDIMRQSACLVLNPITVYSYGFLFNCTTVGQASDSMTALM